MPVYPRGMNSVNLIGNRATDVELRDVGGEKKVANFLLAVDHGGADGGADFVWISAWDRQGEVCAEYLGQGSRVGVEGRLKSRTWEKDGERRDRVEVAARRVEFLSTPSRAGGEGISFETATARGLTAHPAAPSAPPPTPRGRGRAARASKVGPVRSASPE